MADFAELDEARTVDVSYEWLDEGEQAGFSPPRDTVSVVLTGNKLRAVPASLLDPLGHGEYTISSSAPGLGERERACNVAEQAGI